jgi:hypothetical protein
LLCGYFGSLGACWLPVQVVGSSLARKHMHGDPNLAFAKRGPIRDSLSSVGSGKSVTRFSGQQPTAQTRTLSTPGQQRRQRCAERPDRHCQATYELGLRCLTNRGDANRWQICDDIFTACELCVTCCTVGVTQWWAGAPCGQVDVDMSTRDQALVGLPDAALLEAIQRALQQVGPWSLLRMAVVVSNSRSDPDGWMDVFA